MKFKVFAIIFINFFIINQIQSLIYSKRSTSNTNVIKQITIDLKSKLTNSTSQYIELDDQLLKFKSNDQISSSRLHSNQLNNSILNELFTIKNKTNVMAIKSQLNRSYLCSNIKYCNSKLRKNNLECMFSLNLILYLSGPMELSAQHYNEIKLIKLDLILADFKQDSIHFDRFIYEFNINTADLDNMRLTSANDFLPIGKIMAAVNLNKDLNDLIKYYIEFKDEDRRNLIDLFKLNENNGMISMNKSILNNNYKNSYEFYVDAFVQCSIMQKPLHNRTLIRVNLNLLTQNKQSALMKVTNLIETKSLRKNNTIECIKLSLDQDKVVTVSKTIALAQVLIENLNNGIDIKNELTLAIDSIEPFNKTQFSIEIRYLIDNIYVVYLVLNSEQFNDEQIYLTNIFKIKLKLFYYKNLIAIKDLYLCMNNLETSENLHEELSLIQFEKKLYEVNLNQFLAADNYSTNLELNYVNFNLNNNASLVILNATKNDNLIDYSIQNQNNILFTLNNTARTFLYKNKIEQLQYEFTSMIFDNNDIENISSIIQNLSQLSQSNQKQLSFSTKIILNTELDYVVNDWSIFISQQENDIDSEKSTVYKFFAKFDNLVNNSIIGHLPSVYQLGYSNHHYKLENNNQFFTLNKYDGVLSLTNSNYLDNFLNNEPIKLMVNLESNQHHNLSISTQKIEIIIYNINQTTSSTSHRNFLKINANPVNLDILTNGTNEYRLNFKLNLNLNKILMDSQQTVSSLPKSIRLVNMISAAINRKFDVIETDSNLFLYDSKKASIYLNMSDHVNTLKQLFNKNCHSLEFIAKDYIYLSAIRRQLVDFYQFKLDICFVQGDQNEDSTYILTPILHSSANFEYLIKNNRGFDIFSSKLSQHLSANSLTYFILLAAFLMTTIFLILFVIYLSTKRVKHHCNNNSTHFNNNTEYENNHSNSSGLFRNLYQIPSFFNSKHKPQALSSTTITSESSTSSGCSSQNMLKIRNDLSRTFNDDNYVENIYSKVFNNKNKKSSNFNSAFEVSTIRMDKREESSEDQGIYCIATGLSTYSVSSNFSSVSNSNCADMGCCNDTSRELSQMESYEIDNANNNNNNLKDQTKLSLFDLTKTPNVAACRKQFNNSNQEEHEVHYDQMNKWILTNYNINCNKANYANSSSINNNVEINYERNYKNLLISNQIKNNNSNINDFMNSNIYSGHQSKQPLESNHINSINECII